MNIDIKEHRTQTYNSVSEIMELAQLYCDRGDFDDAVVRFEQAGEEYLKLGDWHQFLKCQKSILRMRAEQGEKLEVDRIRSRLVELSKGAEGHPLSAKVYYIFGLCAAYDENFEVAQSHLAQALELAVKLDEKEDICYAMSGLANVHVILGRYAAALSEIKKLQVMFQLISVPEIEISVRLTLSHIYRLKREFEESQRVLHELAPKVHAQRNWYLYISWLFARGAAYGDQGIVDQALLYLNLAAQGVHERNYKSLALRLRQRIEDLQAAQGGQFDLVYHPKSNLLVERKKGRIFLKSQFVLHDMLKLFLKEPGKIHSKEGLVRDIWGQSYDPRLHDNKIYVTIKRLRELIEPDLNRPKYIFRAKNGYYMSKTAKVSISQSDVGDPKVDDGGSG